MSKYECSICGFVYDEKLGYPDGDILPKTLWDDIPSSFVCPVCGAPKDDFFKQEDSNNSTITELDSPSSIELPEELDYTAMELSAIFSNLSKGCEKQYYPEMADLYKQLSSYYGKTHSTEGKSNFEDLKAILADDILSNFPIANEIAKQNYDRGSLRAIKWSTQVTRMINSHLKRIALNSPEYLKDFNIYVCDICGFIHIGKEKPEICPVCKVPNIKITQIKRGA
jgi:rubredoxin/predicted Zn-ribbon and HTH transcriptional regulator